MNVWKLNLMCTYFVLIFVFSIVHSEQHDTKRLLLNDPDAVLNRLRILEEKFAQLGTPTQTGSTYIIWGRKQCPNNTSELVYSGFAGGGGVVETGAAADYVCLTPDPVFNKTSGTDHGRMYGAEYETNFWAKDSHNEDVPCSLCRSSYATTVMIPGTNVCNNGWTRQYYGYLASGHHGHPAASAFVCVDISPEYLRAGSRDSDGKLFYDVIAKCGSLPCPPYVNDYPLTCVVCSK